MDEPGKGTLEDESKTGTPGDESKKGTPKDKGKLYKAADIDKIKSDAAKMGQGRAEKVAEGAKEALTEELTATKSRLDALEREARESRVAQARGDPAAMRLFQREEIVEKREREAETKERDNTRQAGLLKTEREEFEANQSVMSVAYIATKYGLAPERLEKLGIKDPEALEKVAEEIAAGTKPEGKGEDALKQEYEALETDEAKEAFVVAHPGFSAEGGEFHADSGDDSGKGEPTEEQRLTERYPSMAKK